MLTEKQIVDLPEETLFWTYVEPRIFGMDLGNHLGSVKPVRVGPTSRKCEGEDRSEVVYRFFLAHPNGELVLDGSIPVDSYFDWDPEAGDWFYANFFLTEKEANEDHDLILATQLDQKLKEAMTLCSFMDLQTEQYFRGEIGQIIRQLHAKFRKGATDAH